MSLVLASLVGLSFDAALRHTRYDPSRYSPEFAETLNGPQTPGVIVHLKGRDLILFETCTANLCAAQHSVVAVDVSSGQEYAASYRDGRVDHIISAPFGWIIDKACREQSCDSPEQIRGEQ